MKKMLSLLLALALVFSLAACGSTGAPAPAEPTAAPAEEEAAPVESLLGTQPVTITFWHCASDEAGVLMDKYIEEFNSTNEYGITVNAVYQGQYSDASTLLKAIISGGNFEELPDLMQLDATGKMTYYNSGKAFTVDQAVAAYAEPGCLDTYLSAALANWQFAGSQLGLPFAFASHFAPDMLFQALHLYRSNFKPSARLEKPYAMVCINIIAADSNRDAEFLFTSMQQAFVKLRRGETGQLPPPIQNMDQFWSPSEQYGVQQALSMSLVGDKAKVRHGLQSILRETDADEIMVNGQIFDHQARLHSFELVMDVKEELLG